MQIKVIQDVQTEPVTLAEARLQCKVDDDTSHDAVLTGLITAAREFAEHYTGRALAPRTLEAALDRFPAKDRFIDLTMPPVSSVTSVKYTDAGGAEQTFASDLYALSTFGDSRRVSLANGACWPATQCVADAVRIRFETGYAAGALPKAIKSAILLHVELEFPLNPLSPAEREMMEKARDSLLNTKKIWGG